jgi:hypothetical protein
VTSRRPDNDPSYTFEETRSYRIYKAGLGLSEEEIEPHVQAIKAMLMDDPKRWSVPAPRKPDYRIAASEQTPYSPHALKVVFRINGTVIELIAIALRDERRGAPFDPA